MLKRIMDIEKEQKKMKQFNMIDFIKNKLGTETWLDAYFSERKLHPQVCFYSIIVPNKEVKKSLSDFAWDISFGDGLPCCEKHYLKNAYKTKYLKYGNSRNIKPLVVYRTFWDSKPSYIEILEEFRLFHNLYFDKLNNKYIKINDHGEEEDIILIDGFNVKIKISAVKEFLAITNSSLVILFDIKCHSKLSLADLNISDSCETYQKNNIIFNFATRNIKHMGDENKSLSRLLGKKIIKGFPKNKCNIWPYSEEKEKQYVEFITGVDEYNQEIVTSCDRSYWENFHKAVSFKREVLNKYYSDHDKYTVGDGGISCGNLWHLPIDNDNSDRVVVLLGDLGKLSYNEQMYWRAFNVPHQGNMSKTSFNRNFMCIAIDSESSDLKFKQNFDRFNEKWEIKYGWKLFSPLSKDDEYHNKTLRIPLTDNQGEFDEQIRGLVKILIDSINEKELNKILECDVKGSISKLEKFFESEDVNGFEQYIEFLRNLQALRSAAIAHRKGGNYKKIAKELGIDTKPLKVVFEEILEQASEFLEFLDYQFLK